MRPDEEQDELDELDEDTQKDKFLTFILGNESYGIEVKYVTEIVGVQMITEVPQLPEYLRGIINLRGKIIPIMDVRLRFNKSFLEYNERTCTIVIEIDDVTIGLMVDKVSDVLAITEDEIVPVPDVNKTANRYIRGIGKVGNEIRLLLDSKRLLNDDEYEEISKII